MSQLITLSLMSLVLHATSEADDSVAPSEAPTSLRFSAETERAFKQEAAADFVAWYSTDGKLDIGVGRTDRNKNIHHPICLFLEELEDFCDNQRHKELIVVVIEKHLWTNKILQRHIDRLRDYFVARGYAKVVVQQARGSGRGIHLEHVAKPKAEQAAPGQPATRPELKSEGKQKPQPASKGRSR